MMDGHPMNCAKRLKITRKKLVRERTESKYIKHAKTFLSENTPFEDFLNKRENNRVEESQEDEGNPFR